MKIIRDHGKPYEITARHICAILSGHPHPPPPRPHVGSRVAASAHEKTNDNNFDVFLNRLGKIANPYRFKSNLMAGSRLTSISWSGGVQVRAVSHINSAKTLKCKRAIGHTLKTVSHGKTNLCHANTGVPRGGGRWAAVSRASYPHVGPRVAASAHETLPHL